MKRIVIALLVSLSLFLFSACVNEATEPTGVSGIEQPQIMYDGDIYYYNFDGLISSIPSSFSLIGTIQKVDVTTEPQSDFEASGVDLVAGMEIYAATEDDPDSIAVNVNDEYMFLFKKS